MVVRHQKSEQALDLDCPLPPHPPSCGLCHWRSQRNDMSQAPGVYTQKAIVTVFATLTFGKRINS